MTSHTRIVFLGNVLWTIFQTVNFVKVILCTEM